MKKDEEIRKAGDYKIIHAIPIGDREIVVGENPADKNGQKFMTAFCQNNELFARYDGLLVGDDYAEIIQYFGKRIEEQAKKTREELLKPYFQGIDNTPITTEKCKVLNYGDDDLNGKVVVIKPWILRHEYRTATCQLNLCRGGFGANPNSRGSALFCKNLYSGKESRYERQDVLGTLERNELPAWAELGLIEIEQQEKEKFRHDEPERQGYVGY